MPSGPPRGIDFESTSQSLSISWQQPECGSRGGAIIGYIYSLTDTITGVVDNGETQQTNIEKINLVPCSIYEFSIEALTMIGSGPMSDVLIMETEPVGELFYI